jgi:hypothetical protein
MTSIMHRFTALGVLIASACVPLMGSAAVVVPMPITSWDTPIGNSVLGVGQDLVISGKWSLLPGTQGLIIPWQDGVTMGTGVGSGWYYIENLSETQTVTGTYSINLGTQAPGVHTLKLEFFGGPTCLSSGTCPPDISPTIYFSSARS